VTFDGVLGIPVASKPAVDAPTKWFWTAGELFTYGTVNPTSTYATIEAAVRPTDDEAVINFNAKSWVTLDGLGVRHSNDIGIKNYAGSGGQTGRTIKNCQVLYSADGGICLYADNFTHTVVKILNNEVGYTNLRNAADGSGALEGVTLMHADGADIGYNLVHHCGEEGIDSHGMSANVRVHHNTVHTFIGTAAFRPAIYLDGGGRNRADHNIAYGFQVQGKGYQLNVETAGHTANDITFDHNIAYDCDFGISLDVQGGDYIANVKVLNNTFYQMSFVGLYYNSTTQGKLLGTNEIRNNIFVSSADNDIRDDTTGNASIAASVISHNYFVTSNPSETQGSNAVVAASPLFTNAAAANFGLQPTSPCRDAGTVIQGITDGFVGSAPDIGALEYGAVSGPPRPVTHPRPGLVGVR
jgi:hypothetical protein